MNRDICHLGFVHCQILLCNIFYRVRRSMLQIDGAQYIIVSKKEGKIFLWERERVKNVTELSLIGIRDHDARYSVD